MPVGTSRVVLLVCVRRFAFERRGATLAAELLKEPADTDLADCGRSGSFDCSYGNFNLSFVFTLTFTLLISSLTGYVELFI